MITEQQLIKDKLREAYLSAQIKNSNYSLRAFACKVGLNPGSLSAILNGKRNVSKRVAEKILKNLGVDPQERYEILSKFPYKRRYKKRANLETAKKQKQYELLDSESYKFMAEDIHLIMLSLINCDDFQSDIRWISKRLNASIEKTQAVLKRLTNLQLITISESGKIKRTYSKIRTSDDVSNLAIQKIHQESLDRAHRSLIEDGIAYRDFSNITFAIDVKKIDAAKELIRKFQDDLAELLEGGERNEVYRFSSQLIPLTLEKGTF